MTVVSDVYCVGIRIALNPICSDELPTRIKVLQPIVCHGSLLHCVDIARNQQSPYAWAIISPMDRGPSAPTGRNGWKADLSIQTLASFAQRFRMKSVTS